MTAAGRAVEAHRPRGQWGLSAAQAPAWSQTLALGPGCPHSRESSSYWGIWETPGSGQMAEHPKGDKWGLMQAPEHPRGTLPGPRHYRRATLKFGAPCHWGPGQGPSCLGCWPVAWSPANVGGDPLPMLLQSLFLSRLTVPHSTTYAPRQGTDGLVTCRRGPGSRLRPLSREGVCTCHPAEAGLAEKSCAAEARVVGISCQHPRKGTPLSRQLPRCGGQREQGDEGVEAAKL